MTIYPMAIKHSTDSTQARRRSHPSTQASWLKPPQTRRLLHRRLPLLRFHPRLHPKPPPSADALDSVAWSPNFSMLKVEEEINEKSRFPPLSPLNSVRGKTDHSQYTRITCSNSKRPVNSVRYPRGSKWEFQNSWIISYTLPYYRGVEKKKKKIHLQMRGWRKAGNQPRSRGSRGDMHWN